jgi:predicted secreted protein
MWKDQRELTADDVIIMAKLLNRPMAEIAQRAGVSTPNPAQTKMDPLDEIFHRLSRLESEVSTLRQLIRQKSIEAEDQA